MVWFGPLVLRGSEPSLLASLEIATGTPGRGLADRSDQSQYPMEARGVSVALAHRGALSRGPWS